MALDVHSLYTLGPADFVSHPEMLELISITHDGVSVSYIANKRKIFYTVSLG